MSFSTNKKAAVIVLALCATILAGACTDAATAPTTRRVASQTARPDEVTGDSTACTSGFTVIDGRVVCG